jgi:hypothetical protein
MGGMTENGYTQGKIARLPADVRTELNRRIHNGEVAPALLSWLNGQPAVRAILQSQFTTVDVTPANLSTWRQEGYRDWLERQHNLEQKRELAAYCFQLAKNNKKLLEGSASILAGKIMEIVESVDATAQRELLNEKPASLAALVGSLTKLQSQANMSYRLRQTDRKLKLEERKFEGKFLELFEKYYADRQVREIMATQGDARVKMENLRAHIFGSRPKPEAKPATSPC